MARYALTAFILVLTMSSARAGGPTYAIQLDREYDLALERFHAKDYMSAAARLYQVWKQLPEAELKRDAAEFFMASSLSELGYNQAAVELYDDIVASRRAPELVARALTAMEELLRTRALDEHRLIDNIVYGHQYGDLPPDTSEFVSYYQAVGELQRGFPAWGLKKLQELATSNGYYGWKARRALAVARLEEHNDDGAEKLLRAIVEDKGAPPDILADARLALARILYEQKKFDEAFDQYRSVEAPLPKQDVVLLEKAWDQIQAGNEQKALGLIVGLDAPVYRRLFAPERSLIRAFALKRACQFRAAHLSVLAFRDKWHDTLRAIRTRGDLSKDKLLALAAMRRDDLLPSRRTRDELTREKARLGLIKDEPLRTYMQGVYDTRLALAQTRTNRELDKALVKMADELLAVDEQMSILDYEVGIELFKRMGGGSELVHNEAPLRVPPIASDKVYYHFDGEFWSDELPDYHVLADNRCMK
jgi:hypothetical protein